MKEQNLIELKL